MTSWVARKVFKESLENRFGQDDPYFETVPATRLGGKPKKRRKANPPGLSEHDNRVLTKVKRRAYRLDLCLFNCCGIRFGWSSVIGLVPAIGDVLDMLMALMVFRTCQQVEGGLPTSIRIKMLINIVADFFVGLVPVLGDLVDALFRANTRNAAMLEAHLREKGKQNLRASGMPLPADPSDPDEYDRNEADGVISSQPPSRDEMAMQQQAGRLNNGGGRSGHNTPPVGTHTGAGSSRGARGGGGGGGGGGRNDLRDMEEGVASRHPSSASRKPAAGHKKSGSRRGH